MNNFIICKICVFIYFSYFLLSNFIESMNVASETYNAKYHNYFNKYLKLNNSYKVNSTIIKLSSIFNTKTLEYTGEVIMYYKNRVDNHNYCKINIEHPDFNIKEDYIIRTYINYNYKVGQNYTNLYCNEVQCVYYLYYTRNHYEAFYCTIL